MQFSILGVPFKCTKDMFALEKVKWSIVVYWAHLWRGVIFAVGMLALFAAILAVPAFLSWDALQAFNDSDLALRVLMYVVFSVDCWSKNWLALGVGLLTLWVIILFITSLYINYYITFIKGYKFFERHYFKPLVEKFWSAGFWKPFILILVLGGVIGFAIGFLLRWFDVMDSVISLIGFITGLVLFHIFLHGGSWGFIPVRRRSESEKQLGVSS
jgi:hypothetical protein